MHRPKRPCWQWQGNGEIPDYARRHHQCGRVPAQALGRPTLTKHGFFRSPGTPKGTGNANGVLNLTALPVMGSEGEEAIPGSEPLLDDFLFSRQQDPGITQNISWKKAFSSKQAMIIYQQIENGENQSSTVMFILLGFGNRLELQIILFVLFLTIYILAVMGNLLIVVLVKVDQNLHTPMYFFLMNLSCLESGYISTILPRMLTSFLTGDRSISVGGCITQWFFFGFFGATVCYLLAMMSYDRYLAICKPLHYTSLMTGKLCMQLTFISWMSGLLTNTILTSLMIQLTFCGPNEMDHFFCELYPISNLSCSDPHFVKVATFILGLMGTVPPFLLTLASYICIILIIFRIRSKDAQQKTFSTCSSHLVVVTLFYGSIFIVYIVPETVTLKKLHKPLSLLYTVLTPTLNPFIYSLRNREVKEALCRCTKKFSNRVS
ncbi:olfactory receptor 2AP1-like [Paroedura picta]|uniref:olfactory receptor 2AP1-like n=1 Tax=Paroedura picta TaxID=143630 RepID=UPI004055D5DF